MSLKIDSGKCSELAFNLYQQKRLRLFCDIKVIIDKICIYMHSCVLAAYSPCLESLRFFFRSDEKSREESENWSFKRPLEVTLAPENDDAAKLQCGECAVQFFDFFYIGKIKIEEKHIVHIEYLSSILQVEELLDACEAYRKKANLSEKRMDSRFTHINELNSSKVLIKPPAIVNPEVRQKCAADPPTCFQRQERTLSTPEKEKGFRLNEKIQTFSPESRVSTRKVEKEVGSENPSECSLNNKTCSSKIHHNLQNGVNKKGSQKSATSNVTQPSSVSKQQEKTTSVKRKEVACEEGGVTIYKKKFFLPEVKECNFKGEGTSMLENSTSDLLSHESKLTNESIESNMQSESHEVVNLPTKQKFAGINLTQSANISEPRDITLNPIEKHRTCFQDERPTIPHEKESAVEEEIISNEEKDFLPLSSPGPESNGLSDTNLVTIGHRCVCCNYFAESHYDLLKHMLISNHKKKTCSLCSFQADCWKTLSEHILRHNDPQPFFCVFCNERFDTFCAQNEHISKHTGTVPCSCPICFDLFKSKHDLQRHMSVHTEGEIYVCRQCNFCTANKNEFSSHSLILCDRVFECSQPDCTFNTYLKCSLNNHSMLLHTIQNSYLCELCGDTFPETEDLQEHVLKHEDNSSAFECQVPSCAFKTNMESCFNAHPAQQAHQRANLCEVCGDTFSSTQDLKEHATKHVENVTIFKCSQPKCVFSTNLESCLNAHRAQHAKHAHQNSYLCMVCGEKFSTTYEMQQHIFKHVIGNFPCPFCQFLGKSVNALRQHVTQSHPEVKYEFREIVTPISIKNSMEAVVSETHVSPTPKEPMKMVSNSSGNENCGFGKVKLNAETNQAEVILPGRVSRSYSCSNLLKNSVMDQKVNVTNVVKEQSFPQQKGIASKQKRNSLPLILKKKSRMNLSSGPPVVPLRKD